MKIAIIGGTRSGKSFLGEKLCKKINTSDNIIYIATMKPNCSEDLSRIEGHLNRRKGENFKTIEAFKDVNNIKGKIKEDDTLLLDSVTTLLNNEMFTKDGIKEKLHEKIAKDIKELSDFCKNIVIVSDYIFSDSIIYESFTENYKRELAYLNRNIIEFCDIVIECTYNNYEIHKGEVEGRKLINEIY